MRICHHLYLFVTMTSSPLSFPCSACCAYLVRERRRRRRWWRWGMSLTDSRGFLPILPPSILFGISLSTRPYPLKRESSRVSVSVSSRAAGGRQRGTVSHVTHTQPSSSPPPFSSITRMFPLFLITSSTFSPSYSPPLAPACLHFLDFCSNHFTYKLSSVALNLYNFYFSAVSACVHHIS